MVSSKTLRIYTKMNASYFTAVIVWMILRKHGTTENVKCEDISSCNECIRSKGCSWCSKVNDITYEELSQISLCHPSERILEICEEYLSENPATIMKIITNEPMRNAPKGNSVQIRPQKVLLKLKPAEEFTLDIQFKKAENYPVDLYYLMDFSSSMSKHKNNLSKLGNKLAETMGNLTTDFQLGFGSFVDKVVLPFTSTLPSHLVHPCPKCTAPYSYKNHMSLTRETTRFSAEVEKSQLSGNIDTPEGVFDALMQAIVCQKELNWREKARHIIVVSTDAPFHLAGDGKLGGVVEPNDGLCHLNEEGFYTHSLVFDYPSVSQINQKALDFNKNIIFAVTKKVKKEYLFLSKEIRGSSFGLLDAGGNITDLIRAQYEKITTTIRLTDNAKGPVQITYSALCSQDEKWKLSNECTDLKEGSTALFKVHISVSECSVKKLNNQIVTVKSVGMNETLQIHLETICECGCLERAHPANELNSKFCSYAGDLICGTCACEEGRAGKRCECRGNEGDIVSSADARDCISNNRTNTICSGFGECKCGVCHCYPKENSEEERTGKFCECDNYSCERTNGLLCSGHGICKCGQCSCYSGWSGERCDCPVDGVSCKMNDEEEEVCSGKGSCLCGVCHCYNDTRLDEHRYAGKFCQVCLTCLRQQCQLYNDCVECLSYGSGPHAGNQCKNCSNLFLLNLTGSLEGNTINNESRVSCVSADHSGCTFKYSYHYREDGQLVIVAQDKTVCIEEINLLAVVAGTIGSTVFIGLLSLTIWKILVEIHDKQEFIKFEREKHLASWGKEENPLFKTATSTYENPTYNVDPGNQLNLES